MRAIDQLSADLPFEGLDVPAQRRLAHAEALGGAPEMPFFRDGHETLDLHQRHHDSYPIGIV
jgi:hypothetical protein